MILNNVWIINLDKSIDRMKKIKINFDSLGLKYNRFSAIYGKNVSEEYLNKNVSNICKYLLCNYGLIGCAASHKALWKHLIDSDEEMYLIFEDDIEINTKTIEIISKLEEYINEYNIDYLNLNCINFGCSLVKTEFTIDNYNFGKPLLPLQTNSYIITKNGAKKLLKFIENTIYHIDFEILYVKFFKNFNYYTSYPPILNLTHDDTTIGTKKESLIINVLNMLNLKYYGWFINAPLLTINLFYEINILFLLLMILLYLNYKFISSYILYWFIIFELVALHLIYF